MKMNDAAIKKIDEALKKFPNADSMAVHSIVPSCTFAEAFYMCEVTDMNEDTKNAVKFCLTPAE